MQDAADAIMLETFDHPGVASQAMLPPQPSRAYSQGQRTSSVGQPLQLMDSNQSVPYTGKGKGRARDFDPNQQQQAFTGWDQTTVAGFGQLSVPYVEDSQPFPQQPPNVDPGNFTFSQEQLITWQPLHPDYAQSSFQQEGSFNPQARDFQPTQPQAHSHAHPRPVQAGPAPPLQQPSQTPLRQLYHPAPAFTQQSQNPGLFLGPGSEPNPQQHWQGQPQMPTNPQQLPGAPYRVGVGYRFRPGFGFICQVCGTVMRQPGIHYVVVDYGQGRWCEAAGTEMSEQLNILEDIRRGRWGEPFV
jgi:hypothetical protein